jgi:pyruvate/2-oxoglutarate dehydrogenase complex dihydrolipoamide dehydrogenase (E3) component
MPSFDAIIIGTGQAGPALARRLATAGWRVAIAERNRFGGTCVNTGCTPTKALVASAYAMHMARRGVDFGINIPGPVGVDMPRVKARMDEIRRISQEAVERSLRSTPGITVYQGHARFAGMRTVTVGAERLESGRIFINVGARPAVPSIPGVTEVPYLTSSSILDLAELPRHLVVIGGSYVGLEFAQMYRRFGSEVTVIEAAPRLVAREDPDTCDAVRDILQTEGIVVHVGARTRSVTRASDGVQVALDGAAGSATIEATHLLLATGRRPNTDDLGVDQVGVALDARGYIHVDDTLRTNVPGIWALGECNGHGAFTHTAYDDFQIVAANILDGGHRSLRDRITAYAMFIDPPLGRVGMTETEARAAGHAVLRASMAMEDVTRAWEKGETAGHMKILVDRDSRQILGAEILGTAGDEAIHCILDTMYAKAPAELLQRAVHIHPTVAEFIPTLLESLA